MKRPLPDRSWPIRRDEPSFGTNLRLEQAAFGFEIFVIEPAVIAHPTGVNVIVLAWGLAIDHVLAMTVLHPVAQLVQMLFVSFKNQTRILKRKSVEVSAPTGQMSTVLSE